jgi:hypothetical protein
VDHLELVQCKVCKRWHAVRVSRDNLRRHRNGLFAQDAFPYVPPDLRELFISATCPDCWDLLVVDPITNPTAYN